MMQLEVGATAKLHGCTARVLPVVVLHAVLLKLQSGIYYFHQGRAGMQAVARRWSYETNDWGKHDGGSPFVAGRDY